MEQPENAYLGLLLKNWAARLSPSGQCRERLLMLALHASPPADPPYVIGAYQRYDQPVNWSGYRLAWGVDQAFQASLAAACIML